MLSQVYKQQVATLLSVLPEVGSEPCFALHGGTAINLFVLDLPRLSVDIDLTYIPIEDRASSLRNINAALLRIKGRLEAATPGMALELRQASSKLLVSLQGSSTKIEVNQVKRGVLRAPANLKLCEAAQAEFDTFCAVPVVDQGQLYGGKICAALNRQHPRDLFDIRHLLGAGRLAEEVKTGFLLNLVGHSRPINEVIRPRLLDQRQALEGQFAGMSNLEFSYDDFEGARRQLVRRIHADLTDRDRDFLLSVKRAEPDWGIHDFERFPAVQWKLQNLRRLRDAQPRKFNDQLGRLASALGS